MIDCLDQAENSQDSAGVIGQHVQESSAAQGSESDEGAIQGLKS